MAKKNNSSSLPQKIKSPAYMDRNGKIFLGRNHAEIMQSQPFGYFKNTKGNEGNVSGFVTEDDRFVEREEAAEIAWAAGQTKKKYRQLYSEYVIGYKYADGTEREQDGI